MIAFNKDGWVISQLWCAIYQMLQMTDVLRKNPACSLAAYLKAAKMEQLYPISVTKNK